MIRILNIYFTFRQANTSIWQLNLISILLHQKYRLIVVRRIMLRLRYKLKRKIVNLFIQIITVHWKITKAIVVMIMPFNWLVGILVRISPEIWLSIKSIIVITTLRWKNSLPLISSIYSVSLSTSIPISILTISFIYLRPKMSCITSPLVIICIPLYLYHNILKSNMNIKLVKKMRK